MGVHFKSPDPVVRDGVVVLGAAEPGVCGALWLAGVRDRGYLGYVLEELLGYYFHHQGLYCGLTYPVPFWCGGAVGEGGDDIHDSEVQMDCLSIGVQAAVG